MNLLKTSLFALTAVMATTASANVYMGVGAGWTQGKAKDSLTVKRTGKGQNANIRGNGFIADLHVGHLDHIDANTFWTQQLAIAFDTAKAKKSVIFNNGAANINTTLRSTRQYAATAKLGYGMKIDPVWSVAINAGVAQANFAHETIMPTQSFNKNRNVWGWAAGLGVYKSMESYTVGVDYEYTKYQTMKYDFLQGMNQLKAKSPQYHTVMVKFSKTF